MAIYILINILTIYKKVGIINKLSSIREKAGIKNIKNILAKKNRVW